jgi:hypothetical protein
MKHEINIYLKTKNRVINLYTDDESFNDTNIFTCRKSIEIPKNVKGTAEDFCNDSGGYWDSWEELSRGFGRINSQDITDIIIDGKSINENHKKLAEAYGYEMIFPLLYHFQITKDDSENVVNWYPTTGSTTVQNKTQRYSIKKLGTFMDMEDLLIYMKKNDI